MFCARRPFFEIGTRRRNVRRIYAHGRRRFAHGHQFWRHSIPVRNSTVRNNTLGKPSGLRQTSGDPAADGCYRSHAGIWAYTYVWMYSTRAIKPWSKRRNNGIISTSCITATISGGCIGPWLIIWIAINSAHESIVEPLPWVHKLNCKPQRNPRRINYGFYLSR